MLNDRSPLFCCPYRPFFALAVLGLLLMMALWLVALNGQLGAGPAGGWLLWHGHELIFGAMGAATAGFALTAIPEFTGTNNLSVRQLQLVVLLWMAARFSYFVSPWLALAVNLLFWAALLRPLVRPVFAQPERKHLSFIWVIVALALLQLGFWFSLIGDFAALPWLDASIHAFMVLIVLAASRVSMSLLNGGVEAKNETLDLPPPRPYLARLPRRKMLIACLILCAGSEFFFAGQAVTGYFALAAMAAIFGLLNDWHIGKPLWDRFALCLYGSYWLMALGYGVLGAAYLGAPVLPSAGYHLLTVGAMSLSTLCIMSIVARIHSGRWLDRRRWLLLAMFLLLAAALVRAWVGWYEVAFHWLYVAGVLYIASFALWGAYFWRIVLGPREDGRRGCAEPLPLNKA